MLSISIDGSDDDLASLISESFGPEAVSAAMAEVAREALAEAEAINTAALGRAVPYTTLVDGRESSDLDRVRPDGSIVGIFDLTTDILTWIEQQLIAHSPVRTGRYQKNRIASLSTASRPRSRIFRPAPARSFSRHWRPMRRRSSRMTGSRASPGRRLTVCTRLSRRWRGSALVPPPTSASLI
jgi:hypothetical protein